MPMGAALTSASAAPTRVHTDEIHVNQHLVALLPNPPPARKWRVALSAVGLHDSPPLVSETALEC